MNLESILEISEEAKRNNWSQRDLDEYERASIKERDEIGRIELAEKRIALKIAKNLKNLNLPISVIMELTGLSKEEIEKL